MDDLTQFLIRHGGLVLFAVVLAEQVGLPIPAVPVLLAAGALAGAGKMNLALAIVWGLTACFIGDLIWYYLGRYRGRQVLSLLCRISLEPDSCVRRTEDLFVRQGMRSLIIAKFIPGLGTITPALAGLFKVRIARFLLYDGAGASLWSLSYLAAGYLFSEELERMVAYASRMGSYLLLLVIALFVLWIGLKYVQRRRFLKQLVIARITPEELRDKLSAMRDTP